MPKLALPSLFAICCLQSTLMISALVADDPEAVERIAQTATTAQNSGDFAVAAEQWGQIVSQYPDSSQIAVALYQAGFCHMKSGNYAQAGEMLRQAIAKLDPQKKVSIAQAYLYLGYCQSQHGSELKRSEQKTTGQTDNGREADRYLTTATQTFTALLTRYPKFSDIDQALFFQAEAYEELGRFDKAADSYTRMLQLENPKLELDALFALGFIRGKQGRFDQAAELYAQYEAKGQGEAALNEVRFRHGLVLTEMATAAENLGDHNQAGQLLNKAASKFESVYLTRDAEWAGEAKFEQAICLSRTKNYADAASAFVTVVQLPGNRFADEARVYAGRDYMRSGNGNDASQFLEKAVALDNEFSPLGAHWLTQFYLKSNEAGKAYAVASEWIDKTENSNLRLRLMLDKADAAFESKERQAEARTLYLQIATEYPGHWQAPAALYNAAYAAMESGDFAEALKLIGKFKSNYTGSDYLIDVLEVETECYFLSKQPALAEAAVSRLVSDFPNHPKVDLWRLKIGTALHLQQKHAAATQVLGPIVARLDQPGSKAEALHWLASSHREQGDLKPAIEHYRQALQASDTWRLADETLLNLGQALTADQQPKLAKQELQKLIAQFPKSVLVAEARYRLGEFDFADKQYEAAIANFAAVIEQYEKSQFAPYAVYGIGQAYLQQGQEEFAAEAFEKLTAAFPNHELAENLLLQQAAVKRQNGQFDQAIADIERFLETDLTATQRVNAKLQLGLVQMDQQKWPQAISTLEDLLLVASSSELADRLHYELAWAKKSNDQFADALPHFKTIATKFPNSRFASEANFHIGQNAFSRKEFSTAAKYFQFAADSSNIESIKEKSLYKLALSHYQQQEFTLAMGGFQKQLEAFPTGALQADAMFMLGESLYENNQFRQATDRYRVAKPILEESDTVSPDRVILTNLHGARAANQAKEYQLAIDFASSLINDDVEVVVQQEAQMLIGDAHFALQEMDLADQAYRQSAENSGLIGARSRCMVGEILLEMGKFPEAINQFKLVRYGYGGSLAAEPIKQWQAFACFKAGRSNLVQASKSEYSDAEKKKLIRESMQHFQYLVDNYPSDSLAADAQSQLKKLSAMNL